MCVPLTTLGVMTTENFPAVLQIGFAYAFGILFALIVSIPYANRLCGVC